MADLKLRPRFTRQINAEVACLLRTIGNAAIEDSATGTSTTGNAATGSSAKGSSAKGSNVVNSRTVEHPNSSGVPSVGEEMSDAGRMRTSVIDSSVIIRVPRRSDRVWSPQLEVSFESSSERPGCTIYGQFGPRPSIWTSFVAGYLFFLCAGFVGFMFGMTSYWLGMDARMLWVVPVATAGMVGVFLIARTGRRLGREQMIDLNDFLEAAIQECEKADG